MPVGMNALQLTSSSTVVSLLPSSIQFGEVVHQSTGSHFPHCTAIHEDDGRPQISLRSAETAAVKKFLLPSLATMEDPGPSAVL